MNFRSCIINCGSDSIRLLIKIFVRGLIALLAAFILGVKVGRRSRLTRFQSSILRDNTQGAAPIEPTDRTAPPVDFIQEFLSLPASKLALRLDTERSSPPRRSWYHSLGTVTKKLVTPALALSALIVGIGPLYQLNIAAYTFLKQRHDLEKSLSTTEALISALAWEEAGAELNKLSVIAPSEPKLLDLRSVLELEHLLREEQTPRSLSIVEIRFRQTLSRYPSANHLLANAYFDIYPERALKYINAADRLNAGKDPELAILVLADRIWLEARAYDEDKKAVHRGTAENLYAHAQQIMKQHSPNEFPAARFVLDNRYAFFLTSESNGLEWSRKNLEAALRLRNPLYIGKAANNLATILKDRGNILEAAAMIDLAVRYAQIAKDTHGLYIDKYTMGQVKAKQHDWKGADEAYEYAIQGAIPNSDYLVAIYAMIELGKVRLMIDQIDLGAISFREAMTLATAASDNYGSVEADWWLHLVDITRAGDDKRVLGLDEFDKFLGEIELAHPKERDFAAMISTGRWLTGRLRHKAGAIEPSGSDAYDSDICKAWLEKLEKLCH